MRLETRDWRLRALAPIVLVVAACSGSEATFPEDAFAVTASSDLAVGMARVLVGVSTPDGARLGSPEDPVSLQFSPLDDLESTQTVPATFTWILPEAIGIYRAEVNLDRSGPWQVTVLPEEGKPLAPSTFNVFPESVTPPIGSSAPVVATPTQQTHQLSAITTDQNPDPRLYQLSLDEAVLSGKPTVLVFATPAFCTTAACGPMLDQVKTLVDDAPGTNFVHVEVYTGLNEPNFAVDADHLAPAVIAWNLPSEPWVFVIDHTGTVVAKFEGVMDPEELLPYLG